ncbi:hypothetical protein JVU11DRAFT_6712 [Chiua virens]|nr:hypothetical protein JVU11DRAFT_6712 [Chiua virens]
MATYSAFFSSGLLAPGIARCTTPLLPSSPMAISASPIDPIDRRSNSTPTPHGQISLCPKAPEASINAERPRMRKRRSSMNIGMSPMAIIKSPVRTAGAALQRTGLMSPTRHRAVSVTTKEASENNSLFGRLRSGSLGGVSQAPKRLRRMIRTLNPLLPPPSAPLPALPASQNAKSGSSLLPPALLVVMPRQSFATSSYTNNAGPKMPFKLPSDLPSPREDIADEAMDEN